MMIICQNMSHPLSVFIINKKLISTFSRINSIEIMSMYSLLAVASFAPLAFGGDNDDNLPKLEPSGQAYRYDPYERRYGSSYSMHKDGDDKHYDDDNYRSSKQWQRPSKDSKDWKKSADWKKDSYEPNGHAYKYDPYKRTYGRAYRYDPYERTYGRAYSMDKKRKLEEI